MVVPRRLPTESVYGVAEGDGYPGYGVSRLVHAFPVLKNQWRIWKGVARYSCGGSGNYPLPHAPGLFQEFILMGGKCQAQGVTEMRVLYNPIV